MVHPIVEADWTFWRDFPRRFRDRDLGVVNWEELDAVWLAVVRHVTDHHVTIHPSANRHDPLLHFAFIRNRLAAIGSFRSPIVCDPFDWKWLELCWTADWDLFEGIGRCRWILSGILRHVEPTVGRDSIEILRDLERIKANKRKKLSERDWMEGAEAMKDQPATRPQRLRRRQACLDQDLRRQPVDDIGGCRTRVRPTRFYIDVDDASPLAWRRPLGGCSYFFHWCFSFFIQWNLTKFYEQPATIFCRMALSLLPSETMI